MTKPTIADWRKQVDKELAGAAFDKLVITTPEGLRIQPLYTEARVDPGLPGAAPYTRGGAAEARPFQICMRAHAGNVVEQLDGGADAVWLDLHDTEALLVAGARGVPVVLEGSRVPYPDPGAREIEQIQRIPEVWFGDDVIADVLRGRRTLEGGELPLYSLASSVSRTPVRHRMIRVTGLPFHEAGADAADELALMLASAATYARAIVDDGTAIELAVRSMWVQVAIGRDTFGELCKLRALRVCWHKLMSAAGANDTALTAVHAVCSARTQSARDPWVNMLRASTQVFAAALGGAQRITPLPFDAALGTASAHGERVARNTALVLREESHLGRVIDAAGGSYYVEERTDALAREAWVRFTQIERDGGMAKLVTSGGLRERLARSWAAFAARKEPVLGVSEFANADEQVPARGAAVAPPSSALVPHRDDEAFATERAR